jgi:hypothetical protein
VRGFFWSRSKAPLALAALLAVPLYFASLLASSLALDGPRVVEGRDQPPGGGAEGKIWLAALIIPGALLAIGFVAVAVRRVGVYGPAAAGALMCLLMPMVSRGWVARHIHRFPHGMDFLRDSDPSNLSSRGEWEQAAQATIVSITHWTLSIAVGAVIFGALLAIRRRRSRADFPPPLPSAPISGASKTSRTIDL